MTHKAEVLSCLAVRRAIGLLGLFLPIMLYIYARPLGFGMQPSISDFYHTYMGDVLVGSLVAIGVFLISYRGYPRQPGELFSDRWVSSIAGISIILVAIFPVGAPDLAACPPGQSFWTVKARTILCPTQGISAHWEQFSWFHFTAAMVFFVCLACFSLYLFPKGNTRPDGWPNWSSRENQIYLLSGIVLLATLTALGVYVVVTDETKEMLSQKNYIFWCETIGICAFSIAWLTKGQIAKPIMGKGK